MVFAKNSDCIGIYPQEDEDMKLYWRYKKAGKWTWTPAHDWGRCSEGNILVEPMVEVEEE